jgi:DNA-binding IclR family transcriptional regulator
VPKEAKSTPKNALKSTQKSEGGVQSIGRASAVLRAVGNAGIEGARLKDIAEVTGLLPPTVHRLCKAMIAERWLRQPEGQRRYFLGITQPTPAVLATERTLLIQSGRTAVRYLAEKTGDTAYLFLRIGLDVLCVERCTGNYAIKALAVDVGDWRPLGLGAGGLAALAGLQEKERTHVMNMLLIHRPEVRELGADWLEEHVNQTRANAYSVAQYTGLVNGVTGIAAPITWAGGITFGALSVAAIDERLPAGRREEIAEILKYACANIHQLPQAPNPREGLNMASEQI